MYAKTGRAAIAPKKLSRTLLLQASYSVRSARELMEQTDYNLLFHWFVGLSMDASVWWHCVRQKPRPPPGGRCCDEIFGHGGATGPRPILLEIRHAQRDLRIPVAALVVSFIMRSCPVLLPLGGIEPGGDLP